ncbi:MAG: hypothetical protein ACKOI0_00960 [Actinomycetota bacterium]
MSTDGKRRWTFLWGLRGQRIGGRDAFGVGLVGAALDEHVSAARAAERVLGPAHEQRWSWLMPRRARRLLVVAMVATWGLVVAAGLTPAPLAPAFVFSAGASFLVRQASRQLTDLPDRYLDERQIGIRNESFTIAYKVLAGALAIVVAGTVGWLSAVDAGREIALPDLTVDARLAALWVFLWGVQSLPAAVLLWREPDAVESQERADAGA